MPTGKAREVEIERTAGVEQPRRARPARPRSRPGDARRRSARAGTPPAQSPASRRAPARVVLGDQQPFVRAEPQRRARAAARAAQRLQRRRRAEGRADAAADLGAAAQDEPRRGRTGRAASPPRLRGRRRPSRTAIGERRSAHQGACLPCRRRPARRPAPARVPVHGRDEGRLADPRAPAGDQRHGECAPERRAEIGRSDMAERRRADRRRSPRRRSARLRRA